jgi:DNA repair exonuclease SbcCD nuclease subunit
MKQPNLILTSDWHLRETIPICRTDDFWSTQWKKVDFISDLQKKYNCPVLHGGDLYDYWKPSPFLLSETIYHLPKQFFTCYGQHDLPQHNLELDYKSGIYLLLTANKLSTNNRRELQICHWGQDPNQDSLKDANKKILVWHKMNYKGKEPWPGCTDPTSLQLLKKYPEYDLILTGDNHKSFVQEYEGRLLINPGSLMRMDADQIDHKPRVYLYYADTNTVEVVFLPIEKNVISREHLDVVEERNERLTAYVSRLDSKWEVTMSYEKNLEIFEKENNVEQPIVNIINKSLEV